MIGDDEVARVKHDARDRAFALVTAQLSGNADLELDLIQELVAGGPFELAACIATMTELYAGLFEEFAEAKGFDVFDFWQAFVAQLVAIEGRP